ncbi:sugar phosphate nucleotidyltransferase [Pseudomonas sp. GM60]|uniref:sugar phosphate nucleotidyltransferase n=1 Tax=Pseudomonas sp. GM60 TaxID=1144334 RepID=UPI0002706626|nr:sugar phosphate nucleotidyltransferase [Pseudomonas sp. GM60]EJM82062.1 Nucleoside-diphosphate-sugar pyrophosphorylase family protein [Pseudomonas sp. GM60]
MQKNSSNSSPPQNTTILILAAGLATRMGLLCQKTPKCMLPVANKPFLLWMVGCYCSHGYPVVIGTGHLHEAIHNIFESPFWEMRGVRCIREPYSLGTGGLIKYASEFISTDYIMTLNGDTLLDIDIEAIIKQHVTGLSPITQVVTRKSLQNEGAIVVNNAGTVVSFNEDKAICKTIENDHSRFSSTGCYMFNKNFICGSFPTGASSLELDLMPSYAKDLLVSAHINSDLSLLLDFGTPERYTLALQLGAEIKKIYEH